MSDDELIIVPPDGWKDEPVEFKDALIETAFVTINHFLGVIVSAAERGDPLAMDVVAATALIFGKRKGGGGVNN